MQNAFDDSIEIIDLIVAKKNCKILKVIESNSTPRALKM